MPHPGFSTQPDRSGYDVIIVGGAIMGSAAAWFLKDMQDFDGTVLVVERDPSYEFSSTAHTTSCMRQQFSTPLNVKISQFAADFVKDFRRYLGGDQRVPELSIRSYGYLYLADNENFAKTLEQNRDVQVSAGAATQLLEPAEIRRKFPFYNVDDIVLGSINQQDEGYWDGAAVFDWLRRQAQERGAEYVSGEVVDITTRQSKIESVTLASGEVIGCNYLVNASGPRAALTAKMAGIDIPVEPRKRYSWVFKAEQPIDQDLPLTIDPTGVHVRENGGGTYQCGGHWGPDPAVDYDDFQMDQDIWMEYIWPTLANRIPQFEAIKVQAEWAGHYAMNSFDHNAVVGPHPQIGNFLFLNGFSGHGLQQAPAMGRAIAEMITFERYKTLDLSPFHFDRILANEPIREAVVI